MKVEIATGVSRKLNHQQYGGKPFESSDVWLSYKQELDLKEEPDMTFAEQIERATKDIHAEAQRTLDQLVQKTISTIH